MPLKAPVQRVVNLWKVQDMLNDDIIKLDAVYQRDIVWHTGKMSMLIDSIMKRFYIPPLLFAVRTDENGKKIRVCIDGKQRLTSILRFTRNEFPYLDESSGSVEEVFFDPTSGDNNGRGATEDNITRRFFTNTQREKFYDAELLMMEFSDLDEDEELEIFARVQMGVSITAAEKLVATNSEVSKFCRDLLQDNEHLNQTIRQLLNSSSFKWIAQLTYILHEKDSSFVATQQRLMQFLRERKEPLGDQFRRSVKRTVRWLDALCQNDAGKNAMLYKDGVTGRKRKDVLRNIEFLVFGVYVHELRNNVRVPDLASDLTSLRQYFVEEYNRQLHTGNPCWSAGNVWLDRMKATKRRTAPANSNVGSSNGGSRQGVMAESDISSVDENDIESDEIDDYTQNQLKKQRREPPVSASKRRRTASQKEPVELKQEENTVVATTSAAHGHVNEHGRPLARRGGKKSSGSSRKN